VWSVEEVDDFVRKFLWKGLASASGSP
jgi:hypothetical protein